MKSLNPLLLTVFLFVTGIVVAQENPITIHAGTLFDGKGHVQHDVDIVVQNGKILRIEKASGQATYNLSKLTVLPGWIDVHDHITWHFGPNGRLEDKSETPPEAALAAAGNAWITLMAGFTTIQSVGSPEDKDLRNAINGGEIPGPQILTALRPITDPKLTPDQIREAV